MTELAATYFRALVGFHVQLLVAFPILLCAELLFPRGPQPSTLARLRSVVFWSVYAPVSVAVLLAFGAVLKVLGLSPVVTIAALPMLPAPLGAALAAVSGLIIGDFFFYWLHRFEHWKLWRFHRVHHAVREMNGFSGYHHVTEEFFRLVFITAPVFLLIGNAAAAFPAIGAVAYIQGHYLHSCTRLNLGPLRYIFQDNRFHRIHHSLEPRHFDKNFGAVTPLWDVLFGTAYFPKRDEWPDVGLEEMPEAASVGDYLSAPFVRPEPVSTAGPEHAGATRLFGTPARSDPIRTP